MPGRQLGNAEQRALLGSCSSPIKNETTGVRAAAPLQKCHALYAEIDARVEAAGVRDASYYRVPGFPYFRTDRVLASFGTEVQTIDELGGWTRRMREFDQEAREFEYLNLGLSDEERGEWRFQLLNCGKTLSAFELEDPALRTRLIRVVRPVDEYPGVARMLGLHLLSAPILKARIEREHAAVRARAGAPLPSAQADDMRLWRVTPGADLRLAAQGFERAQPDELGFPGIVDSAWLALAELHAPALWIEAHGERDAPGAPRLSAAGATVDTSDPVVNYHITFTRFGNARLAQINYFIWFKAPDASPANAAADIDGLIWRVTLDPQARPLLYESLHASGRDHRWFPAQPLQLLEKHGYLQEPALLPQGQLDIGTPALWIESGTHRLNRVLPVEEAAPAQAHGYALRRYEELFTLPRPGGGTRSLFGPDGLIAGTASGGGLWISGMRAPAALRLLGHHPTTYIGRRHFDDAFALEAVFAPVDLAPLPSEQTPGPALSWPTTAP